MDPTGVETILRAEYPYGHPDFIPRMLELVKLHSDKNHDYALGGPALGNFERTGQIMALYPKFPWATDYGCATVQMLKQFDAFMWQAQDPSFKPKVEGGDTRLRDVTVFSQLIAIMVEAAQRLAQPSLKKTRGPDDRIGLVPPTPENPLGLAEVCPVLFCPFPLGAHEHSRGAKWGESLVCISHDCGRFIGIEAANSLYCLKCLEAAK